MSICLCDISALEAIRSSGKLVGELMDHPRTSSLDGCRAPNAAELDDLLVGLGVRTRPVHVLTPEGSSTHRQLGVVRRRCTCRLPRASLLKVEEGILVASPELLIVQMAELGNVDEVELAQLASELCGTYLLDPNKESWEGFTNIDKAVCSLARIGGTLGAFGKMRGATKLRRALAGAVEGSHSPMETVLALLMTLPRSVGGMGFSGVVMNYKVNTGNSYYLVDLAFPKLRVGLEYNGLQYHAIEQSARDDRRQNELIGQGWTIINVWIDDLKDPVKFARLISSLMRTMGRRTRPGDAFLKRQANLRKRLVPGCRS